MIDGPTPHTTPGPASGTRLAIAVVLLLGCPAAPFSVALDDYLRGPVAFLASLTVQLVTIGFLLWSARLAAVARTRPGVVDALSTLLPAVGSAAALVVVGAVAEAYGIRGSAWPRVQQGLADATDVAYLVATGAIVATLACALLTLALLVRARLRHGSAPEDPTHGRLAP